MIATECEIIPVEFVMRAYVTGRDHDVHLVPLLARRASLLRARLARGHAQEPKAGPSDSYPSTKAEKGGHDQSVSREEVLASGALTAAEFDRAAELCARVFAFGQSLASQRGLNPGRHQV